MRKLKFFTNFDKEEKWLHLMARQGWRFINKTSFGYKFNPSEPEDATIKMDFRTFKKQEDFQDYLALFEDSGWEHVAGTKSSGYQYFRKIGNNGSEDIFSDADSKAVRYKRISEMWAALVVAFVPILIALVSTDAIDPGVLLHPEALYYTPGLWDMNGAAFWRAFLFETPFALFRGVSWLVLLVMIILYLYFAVKAYRQYKKTNAELIR